MNLNLHLVNLLALRICTKVGAAQGWEILSPQAEFAVTFSPAASRFISMIYLSIY